MTERYAVFGNPLEHSRSPDIHRAFAAQQNSEIHYDRIVVAEEEFDDTVREFFQLGGKGANVTVPFKEAAFRLCDRTTERAARAGAVNTLWQNAAGKLFGDNTDGVGLVNDLVRNLHWKIRQQRVLILGAGGAVRGVLGPLLDEDPAEIMICNRTVEKAEALVERFRDSGIPLYATGFNTLRGTFDIVINAVSAGLHGDMPSLPSGLFSGHGCAYDMLYGAQVTPFVEWSTGRAIQVADGVGMLVEQAAESFFIWRDWRPDTAPVIADLRKERQ